MGTGDAEVGRFRLGREIGSGGMGIVYRATDPELGRTVALKLIRPDLSAGPAFRARFERERKAQAALDHPSIVHVYDSGVTADGRLYLATQFVDGPDLGQLLAAGPLSPVEAIRVLAPIAAALDYAHRAGTVHRDVKPQNILCADDGRVLLGDFGLARIGGQDGLTATGGFIGTVAYASPEQLSEGETTGRSDVYSLACVLHECLTGEPPFAAGSGFEVAVAQMRDEAPRPSEVNPRLPEQVDAVLGRGYAKLPAARYPSASELVGAAAGALHVATPPQEPRTAAAAGPRQTQTMRPRPERQATTIASPGPPAGTVEGDRDRRPPPASGSRARWVAIAAVSLALVPAAIFLLRDEGASGTEGLDARAGSEAIVLAHPSDWRRARDGTPIEGLAFRDPVHLAGPAASGAEITAGMVRAQGRLLLPEPFLNTLPRRPAQRASIRLPEGRAFLYRGLRPEGTKRLLDLYVTPTDRGVATLACLRPRGGEEATACGAIAATMAPRRARIYPLGPAQDYASLLDRTLSRLDRSRARLRRRLDAADSPAAQASAAAGLESAFGQAARRLAQADLSPRDEPANRRLAAAMRAVANGYGALATAARGADPAGFEAAAAAVSADEAKLERRLAALSPLGYRAAADE